VLRWRESWDRSGRLGLGFMVRKAVRLRGGGDKHHILSGFSTPRDDGHRGSSILLVASLLFWRRRDRGIWRGGGE
jgi:hypothetical protein